MDEIGHAGLEQYHYKAIRDNPRYALEGLQDVLYEEMMMAMPLSPIGETIIERSVYTNVSLERYNQLQGLVIYLKNKLEEHVTYTKKKDSQSRNKHEDRFLSE